MFYCEKTILYTKLRYTEDHIFCSLPHIYKIWYNILGNSNIMHKVHLIQKRIISIRLVLGTRNSCRNWFMKHDLVTVYQHVNCIFKRLNQILSLH